MADPGGNFGQRGIASGGAIGQINRVKPPEADQQAMHRFAPFQPVPQPRTRCLKPRQAGQRIAARRESIGMQSVHPAAHSTRPLPKCSNWPYAPAIMRKPPAIALLVSDTPRAAEAAEALREDNAFVPLDEADVAVVLGGDGQMLHALHEMLDTGHVIPAYGLNLGTVGFLMNRPKSSRLLAERIVRAKQLTITPLAMTATLGSGKQVTRLAINEVSLLRETRQTARLEVSVNGKVRMAELYCDGVLVATPAGSTAYNLSANGPILPLTSALVALTPISPFRPRRWRGAILPDHYEITFRVLDPGKRPVAAVADQKELRDIVEVQVKVARDQQLTLLFDPGKTLEERIFAEQFQV
jgi:NAD+ kinase